MNQEQASVTGWNLSHGAAKVGSVLDCIVNSGDPEARATCFEGNGLVPQNPDAAIFQSLSDEVWVSRMVVIAENGDRSPLGPEFRQHIGARLCLQCSWTIMTAFPDRPRNEVSSDDDEIGLGRVYQIHDVCYVVLSEEFSVVDIADLGNAETVESRRQAT
jgi:hypothetical protein